MLPGENLEYYHHIWICLLPMLPIHVTWTTVVIPDPVAEPMIRNIRVEIRPSSKAAIRDAEICDDFASEYDFTKEPKP